MQFEAFKKSLQDKIQPIYIIGGKEFYLVNNALNNLITACNVTMPEMNTTYIDEQIPIDEIITMCEALPFMSDKRMVIVKNYSLDQNALDKIKNYLKNYNATTCLVFTSLTSINDKDIPTVICDELSPATLASKIGMEAKLAGLEIQPPALIKLLKFSNNSITAAMNELDKLINYCKDSKVITSQDIDSVCFKVEEDTNLFDLTDAIAKKDKQTAISIMTKLIKDDDTKGVIALLYSFFRKLFYTVAGKSRSDQELATLLGVKPYAIGIYKQQARAIGAEKILNAMNMLTKIDTATKSSFTSLEEELYLFLFYTLS